MSESRYKPDIAATILARVAEGESLRQVCRSPGMPPESTVRQWVNDDREGFAARYHAARRMQCEAWGDLIIEITNCPDLETNDKRLRVDTLKWLMSKIAPKNYGDRLLVAGEANNPVRVLHEHVSLDTLSGHQLDALERLTAALLVEQR